MARRPCPVCAQYNPELLYHQNFHNNVISLMTAYDVVCCRTCGFIYADKIPGQEEFNQYYENMSKYEFNYRHGLLPEDYAHHFQKIVDFLIPHLINKSRRILDIGCSTGGLLSVLKSAGYTNVFGIDPSSSCVAAAKELYQVSASVHNISNYVPEKKFDVVVLCAVLEHLVDFEGSLQKIRALLNDDGLFVVEVPDIERFGQFVAAPFQQFSVEHINYFSRNSLERMLNKYGFRVCEMKQNQSKLNMVVEPDIYAVMQKTNHKCLSNIQYDEDGKKAVLNYIEKSFSADSRIKSIIHEKIKNYKKIIVWGIGTHTQRLLGCGLQTEKIAYFIDSNDKYCGREINGIPIKKPEMIDKDDAFPILISTYTYQEEIVTYIRNIMKLSNEVVTIY